jgi:hypothetical protein
MQHVLEQEHVLCSDNIQVNRNVRLNIARVVTSNLANNRRMPTVEQELISHSEHVSSSLALVAFELHDLWFFCVVF